MTLRKETYDDINYQLELKTDGTVCFSEWSDKPLCGGGWSGGPSRDFVQCTIILDCIGSRSPSIYREVYEHIQHQKEPGYVALADYCKKKNNALVKKFQMID